MVPPPPAGAWRVHASAGALGVEISSVAIERARAQAANAGHLEFRVANAMQMEPAKEALLLPWIIRTYHDLFRNVGYRMEREEVFRGHKHGVEYEVLISLLKNE